MKLFFTNLIFLFVITMSGQETKSTYTYAVKGLDTLKLDIYTPENIKETDSLPVFIWMHGGGFAGGGRNGTDETNFAKFVTTKGYIGVSISYRLLRQNTKTGFGCNCTKEEKLYTFSQGVIDLLDATNYIHQNSKILKADTSKIIACGSSSGAEVILNAVFMKNYFLSDASKYVHINYVGALALAGAMLDSNFITKDNVVPTVLFHGTNDRAVPFGTAPHHYCKPSKPGYLMLHGSETISKKITELESSVYLNMVKEGGHDVANLDTTQLETIVDFFERTVLNNETIQTKRIITKEEDTISKN